SIRDSHIGMIAEELADIRETIREAKADQGRGDLVPTHTTYEFKSEGLFTCTYTISCGNDKHTCGKDKIWVDIDACKKRYQILYFLADKRWTTPYCEPLGVAVGSDKPMGCS